MLVLIIMLSSANPVHAQTSGSSTLVVTEHIQPLYDAYGGNSNSITVVVNGTSSAVQGPTFTISSIFRPVVVSFVGVTVT